MLLFFEYTENFVTTLLLNQIKLINLATNSMQMHESDEPSASGQFRVTRLNFDWHTFEKQSSVSNLDWHYLKLKRKIYNVLLGA